MAYHEPRPGIAADHRTIEHHAERADVAAVARRGVYRKIFHLLGSENRKCEILRLIVYTRAYRDEWDAVGYARIDVAQRHSAFNRQILANVGAIYFKLIAHDAMNFSQRYATESLNCMDFRPALVKFC